MPPVMIRRGSTLTGMVNEYNRQHRTNLTVAQVARTNGIRNPNRITAGTTLRFPDTFERSTPTSARRNSTPVNSTSPTTRSSRTNTPTATTTESRAITAGGTHQGSQGLGQDAINFARRLGYTAGSQKRGTLYRNGRVLSGPSSDHHHAQRGAYAVDFPARGARGDALARQLARRYGLPGDGSGTFQGRNIRVGNATYRVQLLWKVRGHYDHVHVGFRRVG